LNQPGGQAPAALALDMEHMKNRVRELVKASALESAAKMNYALIYSFYSFDFPSQPATENHKTSGPAGPGGLVLYLPFDKPDDNGLVHDESGAGNDGHVYGAQWVADGKFGGAYHFSLSNFNDRIVIPNGDSLNPDRITVAAWVKATANIGIYEHFLDKDFYHGYSLSVTADHRGRLAWETGNGDAGSGTRMDDNRWHHVAATFDGRMMRCYVDGVESGQPAKKTGPLGKSGWDLCIGNSIVDYGWSELMAYDGLIDEVRIYNRALSAAEIKALATAAEAGLNAATPPADSSTKADPAERLKKVKALYSQGLINKEDYDKKVKEIMDSL
jgi:hypothetical protein